MDKHRGWIRRKLKKNNGGLIKLMEKKMSLKKKILMVIVIVVIAIIPLCFLYSLIQLILEPTKVFVIENRKNL